MVNTETCRDFLKGIHNTLDNIDETRENLKEYPDWVIDGYEPKFVEQLERWTDLLKNHIVTNKPKTE